MQISESFDNIDLTHWYRVTDTQFSVVGVLNEHGVMHDRVSYDAYGNRKHRFGGDSDGNGSVDSIDFGLGTAFATIGSSGYLADLDADFNGVYEGFDLPPYSVPLPMLGQRRSFVPSEGCGAMRSRPLVDD